jgi:15-cis-phytoene synthase
VNPAVSPATIASAPEAAAAYAVCRRITRRSARNFYYAFLVLPRPKRDALSAVYAFMRQCDDISDEPGLLPAEKRRRLTTWLESLHGAVQGAHTDDPVLLALSDAVRRFDIPVRLLDQLAQGTAMDLEEGGGPVRYASFDELYSYCYYVASVVGLVTIRIFGYRDPQAEPLAEQCGVAFQLTNIIRDVQEDARMGRVYLPESDLAEFGCSAAELGNGSDSARLRPVLEREAERARQFYRAADQLLPLIEEDSQPALWVLVTIYRRLLEKIASRGYDVFRKKVELTTAEKLSVLTQGWWRRLAA